MRIDVCGDQHYDEIFIPYADYPARAVSHALNMVGVKTWLDEQQMPANTFNKFADEAKEPPLEQAPTTDNTDD